MEKRYKLKPFQWDFMTSEARYPAFVAGWGTGKTFCGLMKVLEQCRKYKNNLWLVVRKEFTDLRDSTMKDFEEYTGLRIPADKDIKLDNGSVIMFRHGDELDVLQNINLGGFLMEQAEEFSSDSAFQMLRGRLRRKGVEHIGAIIANTKGHNWVWKIWKKKDLGKAPSEEDVKEISLESGLSIEDILAAFNPKHYALFEATTYDNKSNLSKDFILDLVRTKQESPSHYNRFVLNSWEDLDTEDKVIPYSAIIKAVGRYLRPLRQKKIVSCDPAEFGEDETVIYGLENGKIVKRDIFFRKELSETSDRCFDMAYAMECRNIILDPIGIGAGLRSFMIKRASRENIKILSADGRLKASDPKNYYNLRTEMWFNARSRFVDMTVCLPDDDDLLQEELSKVGYEIQSDKTRRVHRKDKIRKADYLGHSPSRAECLIYGLWGEARIEYEDDRKGIGKSLFAEQTNIAKSYVVQSVL